MQKQDVGGAYICPSKRMKARREEESVSSSASKEKEEDNKRVQLAINKGKVRMFMKEKSLSEMTTDSDPMVRERTKIDKIMTAYMLKASVYLSPDDEESFKAICLACVDCIENNKKSFSITDLREFRKKIPNN